MYYNYFKNKYNLIINFVVFLHLYYKNLHTNSELSQIPKANIALKSSQMLFLISTSIAFMYSFPENIG